MKTSSAVCLALQNLQELLLLYALFSNAHACLRMSIFITSCSMLLPWCFSLSLSLSIRHCLVFIFIFIFTFLSNRVEMKITCQCVCTVQRVFRIHTNGKPFSALAIFFSTYWWVVCTPFPIFRLLSLSHSPPFVIRAWKYFVLFVLYLPFEIFFLLFIYFMFSFLVCPVIRFFFHFLLFSFICFHHSEYECTSYSCFHIVFFWCKKNFLFEYILLLAQNSVFLCFTCCFSFPCLSFLFLYE